MKMWNISRDFGGDFILVDLDSTNGSEVNGLAITQPITIETGDELTFGDVSLTFVVMGAFLDPEAAAEHFKKGLILHGTFQLKEAYSEYRKAIRLDPSLADAYFNMGVISWTCKPGKVLRRKRILG